jgi:hypothetical protein
MYHRVDVFYKPEVADWGVGVAARSRRGFELAVFSHQRAIEDAGGRNQQLVGGIAMDLRI